MLYRSNHYRWFVVRYFQSVTVSETFEPIVFSLSRLILFVSGKLFWGQKIKKVCLIHYPNYLCMSNNSKLFLITQFFPVPSFLKTLWNLLTTTQSKSLPIIKMFLQYIKLMIIISFNRIWYKIWVFMDTFSSAKILI